MSHLHVPDGVLPNWIVLASWIITISILALCVLRVRRTHMLRKIPLIGIISAIMVACMMLPIIPFAYHLNLSVVAGIMLGPSLAFIAVFIVDIIIAMFGHGGITVVGLNTIVVGAEAVIGYYLFQIAMAMLKKHSIAWSSGIATVLSLMLSTSLLLGFLYISQVDVQILFEADKERVSTTSFEEKEVSAVEHSTSINVLKFAKAALILLSLGWILEGVITALVIRYVSGVRPDLLLPDAVK